MLTYCYLPAYSRKAVATLTRDAGDRGHRRVRAAARGRAGRDGRTQEVVRGQAAPRPRALVRVAQHETDDVERQWRGDVFVSFDVVLTLFSLGEGRTCTLRGGRT